MDSWAILESSQHQRASRGRAARELISSSLLRFISHTASLFPSLVLSKDSRSLDPIFLFHSSPATKFNAVVSGQTSVKAPERAAFEMHLPEDVYIISVHSLHGPSVNPEGQPLVSINSHYTFPRLSFQFE